LKAIGYWALVLLLSAPALSANSSTVTPRSVELMLGKHGARGTVQRLTRNAGERDLGDYERVLDGVARGDPRWLALVPEIDPGTDADSAESLGIAVAEALPKNATGVLRLIRANRSWLSACSYPMIEPTPKEARSYFRRAIPAVKSVSDPALRPVKKMCLANLVKAQRTPSS
jgi:hypothetical protein